MFDGGRTDLLSSLFDVSFFYCAIPQIATDISRWRSYLSQVKNHKRTRDFNAVRKSKFPGGSFSISLVCWSG